MNVYLTANRAANNASDQAHNPVKLKESQARIQKGCSGQQQHPSEGYALSSHCDLGMRVKIVAYVYLILATISHRLAIAISVALLDEQNHEQNQSKR